MWECCAIALQTRTSVLWGHLCNIPVISGASIHISEGLWGCEKSFNVTILSIHTYLCFMALGIKVFDILSTDCCQLMYCWCYLNFQTVLTFSLFGKLAFHYPLCLPCKLHKAWNLPEVTANWIHFHTEKSFNLQRSNNRTLVQQQFSWRLNCHVLTSS